MIAAICAITLPWITGTLLCRCWFRLNTGYSAWGLYLGIGYLLGVALTTGLLWTLHLLGAKEPVIPVAWLLVVANLGLAWFVWRSGPIEAPRSEPIKPLLWPQQLGWWVLLALVASGMILAGAELMGRPTFPWDAWSAWSVKGKVWFYQGLQVDFIARQDWLQTADSNLYTNEAWQYPQMLPLFQYWVAKWDGAWREGIVNLPWLALALAACFSTYHGLVACKLSRLSAMAITFLISSLPIYAVQIALAGYADIWICVSLLFAVCGGVLLWRHSYRFWIYILALAAILAATKLEGTVWAMLLIATLFMARLQPRVRLIVFGVVVMICCTWWLLGGFAISNSPWGAIILQPNLIELPYLGKYPLAYTAHWSAFASAFLQLPNWHIIWYVVLGSVAVIIASWRYRLARLCAAWLAVGLSFLFVLFFFTKAGIWAESMTASNRLALQWLVSYLFLFGLLVAMLLDQRLVERTDFPSHRGNIE